MSQEEATLVERLSEIPSPYDVSDWETRDDYYLAAGRVSADDVPGLIDIARRWPDWDSPDNDAAGNENELLPVTAWRVLADLRASAAVQPLIDLLCELDEYDDWSADDLPHVFGKIGESAIGPLTRAARNEAIPDYGRSIVVRGLRHIAQNHSDLRDAIVTSLAEMMGSAAGDHVDFNTTLLTELVDLHAVEAAEVIERAFANNLLDLGMMGDWEKVRRVLGVEGLGMKMPENPHNSIERLRTKLGIGAFSDRMVFSHGEIDENAASAYMHRAIDTFSKSPEAQRVIECFGGIGWFRSLLDFGLHRCGETVDTMTLSTVEEFLFDFAPRKISVNPEKSSAIIGELALFWEYLDRVYSLPAAKSIVEWLASDDLVARLHEDLSDPSNYGMAKSMVMAGIAAGYDMTTEAGMAEFMLAHNQASLSARSPSHRAPHPANLPETRPQRRIGRNESCPCGSGKKFKKCCGGSRR
jgi:hypothetical protein